MPYERLVGLHVRDDALYDRYRDAMTPILHRMGGGFRHDFRIAQTLRSDATHPINRLFVIAFPDRATHDRFFSDPDYLAIRERFFAPAVAAATILATCEA